MKKINHLISALIMAAMTAGFASCSSSDEPSSVSDNTPKELTLTIMSTKPVTKAALTTIPTDAEKTINRITIGIFSQDGNTVRTIQEFSDGTASSADETAGTNKFYNPTNGSATVKVVTTQLDPNDQVLVAINAPAGKFNGILNAQNFKDVTINAETAIATDASNSTSQNIAQPQNIPMFGEVTSLSGAGNSYSAHVDVYHLTAKITLSSLKVAFDTSGPYADASFTPTEIFLYSVPDGLKFNYSSPYLTSPTTYYTGETGATGTLTFKGFLSSESLSASALNNSSPNFGTPYYFYTTPNNDVNANKTKLVIKGQFQKNSTDQGTTVYYPVSLNHKVEANGSTGAANSSLNEYQVYPNKDYQCSVTIKTIGSSGPSVDIDPTTATIDITVKDWDVVNQTTVFQ